METSEFALSGQSAARIIGEIARLVPASSAPPEVRVDLSLPASPSRVSHSPLVERFASLKTRRPSDWYRLLVDLHDTSIPGASGIRRVSAVLNEGDPWMRWYAPPEQLELRARDVVSLLVDPRRKLPNLVAAFPVVILLHPFADGNARSALAFCAAMNSVWGIVPERQLGAFQQSVKVRRADLIDAIGKIRTRGDVTAYMDVAGNALLQDPKNLGVDISR